MPGTEMPASAYTLSILINTHSASVIVELARGLIAGVKSAVANETRLKATFDVGNFPARVPGNGKMSGEPLEKMHGRRTTIGKTRAVDLATHPVTKRRFEAVISISLTDALGPLKGSVLQLQSLAGEVILTAGKASAIPNWRNRFNVLCLHG
jgi:hypothetical protein